MKNLFIYVSGALYVSGEYTNFELRGDGKEPVIFTVEKDGVSYDGIQKLTDDFQGEYDAFCIHTEEELKQYSFITRADDHLLNLKKYVMCPIRVPCNNLSQNLSGMCYLTPVNWYNINLFLADHDYKQRIEFMDNLVDDMLLAIYSIAENPKSGVNPRVNETTATTYVDGSTAVQGAAHCDINPSNVLVQYNEDGSVVDSSNGIKLTGYLGKHKTTDGAYVPSLDGCNRQGDLNYFSSRKAARYAGEMLNSEDEEAIKLRNQINKEYRTESNLSLEDDIWAALFTIQHLCYPSKTFNNFVENMLQENKIEDTCTSTESNKNICYKSLFYTAYFKSGKSIGQFDRYSSLVSQGVKIRTTSIKEFFKFDKPCESANDFSYADIQENNTAFQKFQWKMVSYVRDVIDSAGEFFKTANDIMASRKDPNYNRHSSDW
eukprot:GHVR01172566.1.p1 GENE.GHVR01172566.1~~GHVR01172566.1.p1  ORF type:complete len:432 (+),score=64.61 GHVR01172566.1:47-1342(+)